MIANGSGANAAAVCDDVVEPTGRSWPGLAIIEARAICCWVVGQLVDHALHGGDIVHGGLQSGLDRRWQDGAHGVGVAAQRDQCCKGAVVLARVPPADQRPATSATRRRPDKDVAFAGPMGGSLREGIRRNGAVRLASLLLPRLSHAS